MQYGGGGGHRFMKVFHKIPVFFERWLPLMLSQTNLYLCDVKPSEYLKYTEEICHK